MSRRLFGSATGWGGVARLFHWVTAILVIVQITMGLAMAHLEFGLATRFTLFQWHKTTGFMVLLVTLCRLGWRWVDTQPAPPPGTGPLARLAARITHLLLYGLVFGAILAGWIMVSASPLRLPTLLFGLVPVPPIAAPGLQLYQNAVLAHRVFTWSLTGVIAVHGGAAVWHHLVRRDRALVRMWRGT
jgi:cytochrome b561